MEQWRLEDTGESSVKEWWRLDDAQWSGGGGKLEQWLLEVAVGTMELDDWLLEDV